MQSGTLEGGTKIRAFVAGVETMGCGDKPDMADISRAFCNASRIDLVCSVTLLVLLMKPLFLVSRSSKRDLKFIKLPVGLSLGTETLPRDGEILS